MADPFSIISLLAVRDAPKEVEKLRQSLTSLVDVSEQLIDLMEDEDVKEEFGEVSTLYNAIGDFVVTLETLQKRAAKGVNNSRPSQMAIRGVGDSRIASDSPDIRPGVSVRVDYQGKQGSFADLAESVRITGHSMRFQSKLRELRIGMDSAQLQNQRASDQDFLQKLSTLDFQSKQKDAYGKRHANTGQWLLETDEFRKWSEGKAYSVLWCPGNPGAGKTVITSIAVNSIAEKFRGQNVAIIYLYCDYKNNLTHSVSALLSSMLRQLVEQASHSERFNELRRFHDENSQHKNMTEDELLSWICTFSEDFRHVCTFVDALDECPEINRDGLLLHFQKYGQLDKTRLFFTSRLNVDIAPTFSPILRLEIAASTPDVTTYLESEIYNSSRLALFVRRDPDLKEEIIGRVVEKAHGMFLLAGLQIDSLCKQTSSSRVRAALKVLPISVFATYKDWFKRIVDQPKDDAELGMRVMSLVFCAMRPLKIEELRPALAVQPGDCTLNGGDLTEPEIILSVTAGLVSTFQSKDHWRNACLSTRLVHYTLQEYLDTNHELLFPDANRDIASVCLTYLSFDDFRDGPCNPEMIDKRLEDFAFLEHAAWNWHIHLHVVQLELMEQILAFLQTRPKIFAFMQVLERYEKLRIDFGSEESPCNIAHFAAYWNLVDVLAALRTTQAVDSRTVHGDTPLFSAARADHPATVQALLNSNVDINAKNKSDRTALFSAIMPESMRKSPTGTCYSVVATLGQNGANVDIQDHEGKTPVFFAVFGRQLDDLQYLLDQQAKV